MLILSGLMGCTTLSTDIYLPAMPAMEKALGGNVEFTITGFLIGFAIAQLIWGPISDRVGRKKPLFVGMAIFTVGSVGCALSNSITEIVVWRVFQATGACVGPMLSRSMVRDLYARTEAARMLSALMTILALCPYCRATCRRTATRHVVVASHILADGGIERNALCGGVFPARNATRRKARQ
ncbi:MAG: MFS transporter [Porphyromonadaceae bacterium]|nr:MAG: MFS transporter [Porphyromonadaceae bacterium]